MIFNLTTLEMTEGPPPDVYLAWSPDFGRWVALVEAHNTDPDPGTLEVTRPQMAKVAQLMREGMDKAQAFACVGIDLRAPPG